MWSQICSRARLRSRTFDIGPNSAPLFSSRIKETLIGQKSIKVGLLELKLRMCLSLLPIKLGLRAPTLFGRLSTRNKCLNLLLCDCRLVPVTDWPWYASSPSRQPLINILRPLLACNRGGYYKPKMVSDFGFLFLFVFIFTLFDLKYVILRCEYEQE